MHGASQSFLGLTHRMAEIRQNGRLQVLPSAIRIALLPLSSLTLFRSPPLCPLMPSLPLSLSLFFFSLSCTCTQGFTNTFLLSLTPCLVFSLFQFFCFPFFCPLLSAGEKSVLQQSSPAAADCLYMATSYLVRQVGGWRDAANISP